MSYIINMQLYINYVYMTKREKILKKFFDNPESIKYSELELILINYNFEKIDAKGSHVKFKNKLLTNDIIIPLHNNDCK